MTAVAPMTKSASSTTIHDLVPAGLTKASDGMAVVEPKYSKVRIFTETFLKLHCLVDFYRKKYTV